VTEKDHQIWDAPMVDVGVGTIFSPARLDGIGGEVPHNVFMNFLLQVDAKQQKTNYDSIISTQSRCVARIIEASETNSMNAEGA